MSSRIIYITPGAPVKPDFGQPCNGCGVCCLYEPCPLGCVLSARRQGPCVALQWDEQPGLYRCAALVDAVSALRLARWPILRWLAPALAPLLRRMAGRWIAVGRGCDCTLAVLSVSPDGKMHRAEQLRDNPGHDRSH